MLSTPEICFIECHFTSKAPYETARHLEELAGDVDLSQSQEMFERLTEDVAILLEEVRAEASETSDGQVPVSSDAHL